MHIATCITCDHGVAEARTPEQCCYWRLDLESTYFLPAATPPEDDDKTIIGTTRKKRPIKGESQGIDRIMVFTNSLLQCVLFHARDGDGKSGKDGKRNPIFIADRRHTLNHGRVVAKHTF